MKKYTLLFALCVFAFAAKAQYPQTLPMDYTQFFAPTAINANGTNLIKSSYSDWKNPITPDQWTNGNILKNAVIVDNTLSYSNYIDNNKGKAIVTDPGSSYGRVYGHFSLTDGTEYGERAMYLSMLINFSAIRNNDAFVTFGKDYNGNYMRWRLTPIINGNGYNLGVQVNTDAPTGGALYSTVLNKDETYLVVLKMETATSGNETLSLFVNPTLGDTEPTPNATLSAGFTLTKIQSLSFRWTPTGKIAGIRFSDNWENVTRKIPTPTISSFSPTNGVTGTTVRITGTNLTGTTAVNFGSVAASSFTVLSSTEIDAVVGAGASGNVSLTSAGETVSLAGFTWIIDYSQFFATSAMGSNPTLVKTEYAVDPSVISAHEWVAPVQTSFVSPTVENSDLSYSNYVDNNVGKAIVINQNRLTSAYSIISSNEFSDKPYYLSLLLNFSAFRNANDPFLFFGKDYFGLTNRAKLLPVTNGDGYNLAIQLHNETAVTGATLLNKNETYLVVMKVTPSTTGTEYLSMFINPIIGSTEPAVAEATTSLTKTLERIQSIVIRATHTGKLAGLRFSDNWNDAVNGNIRRISATQSATALGLTAASNVTVASGGALTIDAATTANTITVDANGKLNLGENTLTVSDIILKADKTSAPSVSVTKAAEVSGTVKLLKTVDNTKWYFMSFPSAIAVNDITKVSGAGTLGTLGSNWWIKYYDGVSRAVNLGVTSNWKHVTAGQTLNANQGYIIGLDNSLAGDYVLSFPLNKNLLTSAETTKSVAVGAYGEGGSTPANSVGWNLVGIPYMSKLTGSAAGAEFLTFNNGTTYVQQSKADVASIQPYDAFFIQASTATTTENLSFDLTGRQLARTAVDVDSSSERLQIQITNALGSDKTNLIMDDAQSTAYQINQDLEKWLTTGTDIPQIYSHLNGIKYAFNALPVSAVSNLALGVYSKTAIASTIKVDATQATSLSQLLLTDNTTSTTVDLLISDYSFTSSEGSDLSRFVLNAKRVSTNNKWEQTETDGAKMWIENSKLIIEQLSTEKASIAVFDAQGKSLVHQLFNNTVIVPLPAKGMYVVKISANAKTWQKKIIHQ